MEANGHSPIKFETEEEVKRNAAALERRRSRLREKKERIKG